MSPQTETILCPSDGNFQNIQNVRMMTPVKTGPSRCCHVFVMNCVSRCFSSLLNCFCVRVVVLNL